MRTILTALCFAHLAFAAPAEEKAVAAPPAATLTEITAHFAGAEALPQLRALLESGGDVHEADSRGNTPLLLLCESLELDYRYRTEPHYAKAVDEAVTLLLKHKADALQENAEGCNALFYLSGKPDLLKQLTARNLLPPDLAVRIPHEETALLRYMRLRVTQAGLTNNEESRAYLIRRYCAPAYERAAKLLQKYMRAETRRRIPHSALENTLAFMRLADADAAEKLINSLPVWKHGEHFLEEGPEYLLQTLYELNWKVQPELLQSALDCLDPMLPQHAEDLIDCNAGQPMSYLLTMLNAQEGGAPEKQLERFSRSRDSRVAYTALCIRLQRKGLPLPEPETLSNIFHAEAGMELLSETQRRLLECAVVDSAIRNVEPTLLNEGIVRRTHQTLLDMGMPAHAALLAEMTDEEGLCIGEESLARLAEEYIELPSPCPQVVLALYILEHPDMFRQDEQPSPQP